MTVNLYLAGRANLEPVGSVEIIKRIAILGLAIITSSASSVGIRWMCALSAIRALRTSKRFINFDIKPNIY